jgi:hypothetical protein
MRHQSEASKIEQPKWKEQKSDLMERIEQMSIRGSAASKEAQLEINAIET